MHEFLKNVTDGLIPTLTQNVTTAVQAAIDGANTLLTPGAGVIRFEATTGSADYVSRQAERGVYRDQTIVTDAANQGILGTQVVIDVDVIQSFPLSDLQPNGLLIILIGWLM